MSLLFVNENNAVIGVEENRCYVTYADGMKKIVPIETLESITIMGHAQMTTQCVQKCLKCGIPVSYFSKGGVYFGRLQSTGHINAERQRRQCAIYESEFAVELSKNIIRAKLKNQSVVLRRYEKSGSYSVSEPLKMMHICREKISQCSSISEIMGYEDRGRKHILKGYQYLSTVIFSFMEEANARPKMNLIRCLALGILY